MASSAAKTNDDKMHYYMEKSDFRHPFSTGEIMPTVSMDEIKKLVGMQLGKRNVKESDRFVEDLGAESADVANLVVIVEEKYGITIKEAEIASIFTPADLLALAQKRAA
jgi:acyl carrier protein